MSVIERLRANSLVSDTGCWLPKRPVKGYRYVRVDGVLTRAHRAVVGATRTDVVLHTCDTPSCCNPEHLRIGTQSDNMADMNAKGRHPSRKLSDEDVREILKSELSSYALAKSYGVCKETIYKIRKGETYVRLR